MSVDLPILAFNDVYRVRQRYVAQPGCPNNEEHAQDAEINVGQFAKLTRDIRETWLERPDGVRDGLFLFAGDVFSPSVESSVTRGSHMVGAAPRRSCGRWELVADSRFPYSTPLMWTLPVLVGRNTSPCADCRQSRL